MTSGNLALKPECAPAITRTVWTSRFGEIEVEEELVIDMADGLIGFERCKRFVVITPDDGGAFRWFQSLDDGAVAFPILEPWRFKADYAPTISDGDARSLGLTEETPKLLFAVVTVPRNNPRAMTANLLAPLVVNAATRRGRQVIVTDDKYTTRHSILEEMQSSHS
jgi:flagellar assembly factor FliW